MRNKRLKKFQGIEVTANVYTRESRKIMRSARLKDQKLEWAHRNSITQFKRYTNISN